MSANYGRRKLRHLQVRLLLTTLTSHQNQIMGLLIMTNMNHGPGLTKLKKKIKSPLFWFLLLLLESSVISSRWKI